jgi:hypothetical protein
MGYLRATQGGKQNILYMSAMHIQHRNNQKALSLALYSPKTPTAFPYPKAVLSLLWQQGCLRITRYVLYIMGDGVWVRVDLLLCTLDTWSLGGNSCSKYTWRTPIKQLTDATCCTPNPRSPLPFKSGWWRRVDIRWPEPAVNTVNTQYTGT